MCVRERVRVCVRQRGREIVCMREREIDFVYVCMRTPLCVCLCMCLLVTQQACLPCVEMCGYNAGEPH